MGIKFEDKTKSDSQLLAETLEIVMNHAQGNSEECKRLLETFTDVQYQQGLLMALELLSAMVYDMTQSKRLLSAVVSRGVQSAKEMAE